MPTVAKINKSSTNYLKQSHFKHRLKSAVVQDKCFIKGESCDGMWVSKNTDPTVVLEELLVDSLASPHKVRVLMCLSLKSPPDRPNSSLPVLPAQVLRLPKPNVAMVAAPTIRGVSIH